MQDTDNVLISNAFGSVYYVYFIEITFKQKLLSSSSKLMRIHIFAELIQFPVDPRREHVRMWRLAKPLFNEPLTGEPSTIQRYVRAEWESRVSSDSTRLARRELIEQRFGESNHILTFSLGRPYIIPGLGSQSDETSAFKALLSSSSSSRYNVSSSVNSVVSFLAEWLKCFSRSEFPIATACFRSTYW